MLSCFFSSLIYFKAEPEKGYQLDIKDVHSNQPFPFLTINLPNSVVTYGAVTELIHSLYLFP